MDDLNIYQKLSYSLKCLTIDAIEESRSGHPGLPLGMADVVAVLFKDFVKFNIDEPFWLNRDRFILSAGHGSMLLYSILFLLGYKDITLDDIKSFRQLGSKAAGHPEYGYFKAIETTTGPLGQGLANAVGMAITNKFLAEELGTELINHKIYVIVGDGCLMEGISHEAASLAGHLNLNNLIILFDDNKISIDGPINLSCSDDNIARFKSYGWTCFQANGHNYQEIYDVLDEAQTSTKPTFIAFDTIIGHGASNAGTHQMHGLPLGQEEIAKMKASFNYNNVPFQVENLDLWQGISNINRKNYQEWEQTYLNFDSVKKAELDRRLSRKLPMDFPNYIKNCYDEIVKSNIKKEATRKSSGRVLNHIVPYLPELVGGSADLTESNNTKTNFDKAKYIHYGIREHGMAGIMNGIALYNGFIPYGGTFLAFSDYMRPSIRLSALMRQKVIYILTHDSIGLGEDGATHQPIEHLAAFRAMPELLTFRPGDAIETLECWEVALHTNGPSILALTRQEVGQFRSEMKDNKSSKGGYILQDELHPHIIVIATGSEVEIALQVKTLLNAHSLRVRVVSMPCTSLFDKQDLRYQKEVLGNSLLKVAIEAGCQFGWEKYIGLDGLFFGVNQFGASGKKQDLYKYFGLLPDQIAEKIIFKFNEVIGEKSCN